MNYWSKLFVAVLIISLVVTRLAYADYLSSHADLICDSGKNIALARFVEAENNTPPVYTRLPATVDAGLSAHPGTGHRVCTLGNGWEIKIRIGQDQVYAHGMSGAAPPSFFSLWVDHRKVFSKRIWSKQNYAGTRIPIAGVVITSDKVATCEMKSGAGVTPECKSKTIDLKNHSIDPAEYPAEPNKKPAEPGKLMIAAGTNPRNICENIITHGSNSGDMINWRGDPDMKIPASDWEWINTDRSKDATPWNRISDMQQVFGFPAKPRISIQFPSLLEDIDGDGKHDTVIVRSDDSHYFDGAYIIVAPGTVSVREVLETLYGSSAGNDEDVEKDIKHAESLGWHVYSGGRPNLYPNSSSRYTHMDLIDYIGRDYILASPLDQGNDPTDILIQPKADGSFETLCVFQRPRPNY